MADRSSELLKAENEAAAAELALNSELTRLTAASGEVQGRLRALAAGTARAAESGVTDPAFEELRGRAGATPMPSLELTAEREKAWAARAKALEGRHQALEAMRQSVKAYSSELSRLVSQLTADEQALEVLGTRLRDQQKQEQRRQEQRQQAPAPIPAQEAVAAPPPLRKVPAGDLEAGGRRGQARVRMQAAVDLHGESNFFTGFSTNISEGGLFVATVDAVPHGTEVDLAFTLPSGQKVEVKGVVRWSREVNDNTPEIFPGVGVQFVQLNPDVQAAISAFVGTREPLFFPD